MGASPLGSLPPDPTPVVAPPESAPAMQSPVSRFPSIGRRSVGRRSVSRLSPKKDVAALPVAASSDQSTASAGNQTTELPEAVASAYRGLAVFQSLTDGSPAGAQPAATGEALSLRKTFITE